MWILSFAVILARSRASGWKRFRASTLIACEVWTVGIVATYATFVIPVKSHALQTTDVVLRALALILVGWTLTLCLATVAWVAGRAIKLCCVSRNRSLILCAAILLICGTLLFGISRLPAGPSAWTPRIAHAGKAPSSQHDAESGPSDRLPIGIRSKSLDGRLVAICNGPKLSVIDANSSRVVVEFQADPGSWFSAAEFVSGSSYLAALQISEDGCATLMRWDTATWIPQNALRTDELVDHPDCGSVTLVLAGDFMVLAQSRDAAVAQSEVKLSTIDLKEENLTRAPFGTVLLGFDDGRRATRIDSRLSRWYVSPTGDVIISAAGEFDAHGRVLLRRGARHAVSLPEVDPENWALA
jgi:hypothetical protein